MRAARKNGEQITAVLVCPDAELVKGLQDAVPVVPSLTVADRHEQYPSPSALTESIAGCQATALFLDVSTDRAAALKLLQSMLDSIPELAIVALHRSNDPETILQCLRAGAAEFLSAPFAKRDFSQAMLRIARRRQVAARPEPLGRGKLLAFAPVKGGAGCTTLSANIAFTMAARLKARVLLADMNLAGGVLSFLLRLRTPYTVIDALRHSSQLDETLWQSLVVPHQGVDILGAPERPEPPLIEPYPVQEMLDFARGSYDYVIADLAGVVDGVGMTAASSADQVNLVCSTDMPSLFLMRRTIPLLEEMGVDGQRVRILVNRCDKRSELSTEDMEKIFRARVHAMFPEDPTAVLRAHREGALAPESTELSRAIKKYVDDEFGEQPEETPGALGALRQLWGGA